MKATNLKTEYLKNPIGMDIVCPRFFWNCAGGVKQTAYQIIAKSAGKIIWNSGKVASSRMTHIPYGGEPLRSRQKVYWTVKLWDENGLGGELETGTFEMGLLEGSDWKAKWITGDETVNPDARYPVDCFRKAFHANAFVRARLYASACGVYEGMLNGRRIGDFVMAPGYTDYKKRIQYQTYDVTELLREGGNELTFQLADGWYRGSTGAWGLRNQYGTETKLLVQLELTDAAGRVTTVCSDGSWQWSSDGPIRFADNKDGEVVDARYVPSYSGRAKEACRAVVPTASNNVPVREHETFKPDVITTPTGRKVLDFRQNIAGILSFRLTAKDGQKVFLRFGEMLDENGEFTQKNIQLTNKKGTTPLQQVIYTCREGLNEYKVTFAVFGFQYVLVDTAVEWQPGDFTAIAVYSDLERTGWFESSNALLDKFVENTVWSAKNNFLDIPTDCPTRERHGWTGDAQIFYKSAGYLFAFAPFARKFVRDMTDEQKKNGCFRQISPNGGVDSYMHAMDGSVGWSDAGVMIPYRQWKLYGDRQILEANYEAMRRYARFMIGRAGSFTPLSKPILLKGEARKYLVNVGQSYGEWAEPNDIRPFAVMDFVFPHPEESTAYTSYVMELMVRIAKELGKTEDIPLYAQYRDGCKKAYQQLVEKKEHSLDTNRQAKLVRPLYFGLLNETQTEYAKKKLLDVLENYGWRLGTGFLSTPLILYVLETIDPDAAYRLLENEEVPGWLSMPKAGATTIWESWEAAGHKTAVDSRNHYSKGALCEWLFARMCGIQVAEENRFVIAPLPGGHFTHAKARYRSIYGMVESGWEKTEDGYIYEITVPANCEARICLPGREPVAVGAGSYRF